MARNSGAYDMACLPTYLQTGQDLILLPSLPGLRIAMPRKGPLHLKHHNCGIPSPSLTAWFSTWYFFSSRCNLFIYSKFVLPCPTFEDISFNILNLYIAFKKEASGLGRDPTQAHLVMRAARLWIKLCLGVEFQNVPNPQVEEKVLVTLQREKTAGEFVLTSPKESSPGQNWWQTFGVNKSVLT